MAKRPPKDCMIVALTNYEAKKYFKEFENTLIDFHGLKKAAKKAGRTLYFLRKVVLEEELR